MIAIISSDVPIVYVVATGSTTDRIFVSSNVKLPAPSVFKTEPGAGVVLGHTNDPICKVEFELETFDVIISLHVILGISTYYSTSTVINSQNIIFDVPNTTPIQHTIRTQVLSINIVQLYTTSPRLDELYVYCFDKKFENAHCALDIDHKL